MGRPKTLGTMPTEEHFRLSSEMSKAFDAQCKRLGKDKSTVLRQILERWIREQIKLTRLKEKANNGLHRQRA